MVEVRSPLQGTVVRVAAVDDAIGAGADLVVVESMKMEHVVPAPEPCTVVEVLVGVGDLVQAGDLLARVAPGRATGATAPDAGPTGERPELAEVRDRHAIGLDAARPDAVARRRRTGQRTARENVADLLDDGSFLEYGPMVIAAQRR